MWALISDAVAGLTRTTLCNGGLHRRPFGCGGDRGLCGSGRCHVAGGALPRADRASGHARRRNPLPLGPQQRRGRLLLRHGRTGLRTTAVTRDLASRRTSRPSRRGPRLAGRRARGRDGASIVDLGDRRVSITPRRGHTPAISRSRSRTPTSCSAATWCGTRCSRTTWTRSRPSCPRLPAPPARRRRDDLRARTRRRRQREPTSIDTSPCWTRSNKAARRSRDQGKTAAEGAAAFSLPPALGTWALFGPTFFERAFTAWYRELGAR